MFIKKNILKFEILAGLFFILQFTFALPAFAVKPPATANAGAARLELRNDLMAIRAELRSNHDWLPEPEPSDWFNRAWQDTPYILFLKRNAPLFLYGSEIKLDDVFWPQDPESQSINEREVFAILKIDGHPLRLQPGQAVSVRFKFGERRILKVMEIEPSDTDNFKVTFHLSSESGNVPLGAYEYEVRVPSGSLLTTDGARFAVEKYQYENLMSTVEIRYGLGQRVLLTQGIPVTLEIGGTLRTLTFLSSRMEAGTRYVKIRALPPEDFNHDWPRYWTSILYPYQTEVEMFGLKIRVLKAEVNFTSALHFQVNDQPEKRIFFNKGETSSWVALDNSADSPEVLFRIIQDLVSKEGFRIDVQGRKKGSAAYFLAEPVYHLSVPSGAPVSWRISDKIFLTLSNVDEKRKIVWLENVRANFCSSIGFLEPVRIEDDDGFRLVHLKKLEQTESGGYLVELSISEPMMKTQGNESPGTKDSEYEFEWPDPKPLGAGSLGQISLKEVEMQDGIPQSAVFVIDKKRVVLKKKTPQEENLNGHPVTLFLHSMEEISKVDFTKANRWKIRLVLQRRAEKRQKHAGADRRREFRVQPEHESEKERQAAGEIYRLKLSGPGNRAMRLADFLMVDGMAYAGLILNDQRLLWFSQGQSIDVGTPRGVRMIKVLKINQKSKSADVFVSDHGQTAGGKNPALSGLKHGEILYHVPWPGKRMMAFDGFDITLEDTGTIEGRRYVRLGIAGGAKNVVLTEGSSIDVQTGDVVRRVHFRAVTSKETSAHPAHPEFIFDISIEPVIYQPVPMSVASNIKIFQYPEEKSMELDGFRIFFKDIQRRAEGVYYFLIEMDGEHQEWTLKADSSESVMIDVKDEPVILCLKEADYRPLENGYVFSFEVQRAEVRVTNDFPVLEPGIGILMTADAAFDMGALAVLETSHPLAVVTRNWEQIEKIRMLGADRKTPIFDAPTYDAALNKLRKYQKETSRRIYVLVQDRNCPMAKKLQNVPGVEIREVDRDMIDREAEKLGLEGFGLAAELRSLARLESAA